MTSPYLLDTQVLIWAYHLPERLSPKAAAIIQSGEVTVSAASFWEMAIKKDKPGAPILDPNTWWKRYVTKRGLEVLPIHPDHIAHLTTLPSLHRDPFDRILICQAIHEGCSLVTIDHEIHQYKNHVALIW